MNVLVTGASGFVGRHLCDHLVKQGMIVTCLNSKNCDLTEKNNLRKYTIGKYDRIYQVYVQLYQASEGSRFCRQEKP